uniref:RNA-dependent RNA polymerase n=1 Tax=Gran virus TaxID=2651950 RepID=A0A5Q0TW84_9VIRU|nr:RNA-dependent RNA polymerase [Gran virus]
MARVFKTPQYIEAHHLLERVAVASDDDLARFSEWDGFQRDIAVRLAYGDDEIAEALIGSGRSEQRLRSFALACRSIRCDRESFPILWGYHAAMYLWHRVVSRFCPGSCIWTSDALSCAEEASVMAAMGMVAGFQTGSVSLSHTSRLSASAIKDALGRNAAAVLSVPDLLRSEMAYVELRKAFDRIDDEDFDRSSIRIPQGGSSWHGAMGLTEVYWVAGMAVVVADGCLVMVNEAVRSAVADTVWSSILWRIHSEIGDQCAECPVNAARATHDYVVAAVRSRRHKRESTETLAAQMKAAYSSRMALLTLDDETPSDLALLQSSALSEAADALRCSEEPYTECLKAMCDKCAMNYGTAWNLLPAPDASIASLDKAIREKYNAPRGVNDHTWDAFMSYARGAISATYLMSRRDELHANEVTMSDGTLASDHEWAVSCLSGTLEYPPAGGTAFIERVLPWSEVMEDWHLRADDVTHVSCSLDGFVHGRVAVKRELEWVCDNGSRFSNGWKPARVREAWRAGHIPGDRVLYTAAKSENTKYGAKIRETMSGDDVMRAVLSEIDENMSHLATYVDGVAMRAPPYAVEAKMSAIVRDEASIKLSLDVSGWSPNMIRTKEMAFIDMLMSFFKIPAEQTASCVFKNTWVVSTRGAYFAKWEATDGSIQGFFGTADTILHSMMAQWCMRQCKTRGVFPEAATMKKVCLIDDIVMSFNGANVGDQELIKMVSEEYKALGFEADAVKTIASRTHCHFLNRIYSIRGEILTFAKIMAKADREHERLWVPFEAEVESIFGAFKGAADRGMAVWEAYSMACWRTVWRARFVSRSAVESDRRFAYWGAFLPVNLGGWGVPSVTSWLTNSVTDAMTQGLCAIGVIQRHVGHSGEFKREMDALITAALTQDLSPQTDWLYIQNHRAPRAASMERPMSHVDRLVARLADTSVRDPAMRQLLSLPTSQAYEDSVVQVVSQITWQSDILVEFMESLPHAASITILGKLASCKWFLRRAPLAMRNVMRANFTRANRRSVSAFTQVEPNRSLKVSIDSTASEWVEALRSRSPCSSRICIVDHVRPTVTDVLANAGTAAAHIEVYAPASPFDAPKPGGSVLKKTYAAPRVAVVGSDGLKMSSILGRAFHRASIAMAAAECMLYPAEQLRDAWCAAWGLPNELRWPALGTDSSNTARMMTTSRCRAFATSCNVNLSSQTSVDMHKYLSVAEHVSMTTPHSLVLTTCKLMSVVACEMGEFDGTRGAAQRRYVMRKNALSVRPDPVDQRSVELALPSFPMLSIPYAALAEVEVALEARQGEAGREVVAHGARGCSAPAAGAAVLARGFGMPALRALIDASSALPRATTGNADVSVRDSGARHEARWASSALAIISQAYAAAGVQPDSVHVHIRAKVVSRVWRGEMTLAGAIAECPALGLSQAALDSIIADLRSIGSPPEALASEMDALRSTTRGSIRARNAVIEMARWITMSRSREDMPEKATLFETSAHWERRSIAAAGEGEVMYAKVMSAVIYCIAMCPVRTAAAVLGACVGGVGVAWGNYTRRAVRIADAVTHFDQYANSVQLPSTDGRTLVANWHDLYIREIRIMAPIVPQSLRGEARMSAGVPTTEATVAAPSRHGQFKVSQEVEAASSLALMSCVRTYVAPEAVAERVRAIMTGQRMGEDGSREAAVAEEAETDAGYAAAERIRSLLSAGALRLADMRDSADEHAASPENLHALMNEEERVMYPLSDLSRSGLQWRLTLLEQLRHGHSGMAPDA